MQSFFSLSWVLTWFAHNVDAFAIVQHYFDFFLSSHPSMPIYMVVALILTQRSPLLALRHSTVEGEGVEASAIHALFQSLVVDDERECSAMCEAARAMYDKWPPRVLCELTPTPPGEASKVRVKGMERLMEDMQAEEQRRKRREEGGVDGGGGEAGGSGGGREGRMVKWKEWKEWMNDELKCKRVREWSLMGVTAVSAAVALAAYRMYGTHSST